MGNLEIKIFNFNCKKNFNKKVTTVFAKIQMWVSFEDLLKTNAMCHVVVIKMKFAVVYGGIQFIV
jgi:hypothetical protein